MDILIEQIALVCLDDIIARKRGERQYVGCIVGSIRIVGCIERNRFGRDDSQTRLSRFLDQRRIGLCNRHGNLRNAIGWYIDGRAP